MTTENTVAPAIASPCPSARRVLVLAPHADDEVFGCGGTLHLLAEAGASITVIIVSNGALGGEDADGSLVRMREAESNAAAQVLGYPAPIFWRLPDRGVRYDDALVARILEKMQSTDADLIFAPAISEVHPDHRAVAMAATEALRRCGAEDDQRRIAFYEVGAPLLPNTLIDISTAESLKLEAMLCFPSQLAQYQYDKRLVAIGRYRSYHLGKKISAAEAFIITTVASLAAELPPPFESTTDFCQRLGYAADGRDIPLVSVVIRSMDRPTLVDAVNSVIAQTYPKIEIILVNATGGKHSAIPATGQVPLRLVEQGEYLRRSRAANLGLENAQGEFLIILDEDDWFDPSHIAQLVETLASDGNAVAAFSGTRCLSDVAGSFDVARKCHEPFDPTRLMVEDFIPIHTLLFRRRVLEGDRERACRFDEALNIFEDWDFLLQLLMHGDFVRQETISATYRIHTGSDLHLEQQYRIATDEHLRLEQHLRIAEDERLRLEQQFRMAEDERLRLAQQLSIAEEERPHFEQQFHIADEARQRLEQQLGMADNERQHLEQQLGMADNERQHLEQQLGMAADERQRLLQQLRIAEDERLRLEQQLRMAEDGHQRLLRSRSWRITSPLRWLSEKLSFLQAVPTEFNGRALVWRILAGCYRSTLLAPMRGLITITMKRRLRDYFSHAHAPREMPVISGQPVDSPLVSIIIPVYQHAEYLRRCISSALTQSYTNIEVVVVDDASPDPQVREILAEFAGDPRARIFHHETNLGISLAQNRALRESKGGIIAFLDCDDFLSADAVETCLHYWNAETVYSHSARINIDKHGEEVSRICFQHTAREDYFVENLAAMYATHFKMIRRDAFAKVGLFDPRFDTAQDYDMLMRIAFHYASACFAYVPHFIYFHRFHERQATETAQSRQAKAVAIVQAEARMRHSIREGKFDKKLSFIMLSFGKQTQTLDAIKSLKRTVRVPHEIILFDNGSDPETVTFLKEHVDGKFENLMVYYSDRNLGPADGRRAALEKARGDWFIIFDNDEIAEEGWLEEMLVRASSDPKIGAVTCKVIFPDRSLQCCGGYIEPVRDDVIHLQLYGRGLDTYNLETAEFRDCDWCPIGATLFTVNPVIFLHAGYPNIFEDIGVSMAMRRLGYRLVNSPGSWVWHEHVTFRKNVEMGARYTKERYDPKRMLISVASFYRENGLIIEDEYVWRENQLTEMSLESVRKLLEKVASETYPKTLSSNHGKAD